MHALLYSRAAVSGALLATVGAALSGPATAAVSRKTAVFNVTAIHSGPGVQVTLNSKVWITPTQARASVSDPIGGEKLFLVTDGFFYQLDPKTRRGTKAPLPEEFKKRADNFAALVGRFAFDASGALRKAKKMRAESVSGRQCDVYTYSEKQQEAVRAITVWMPRKMRPRLAVKAVMTDRLNRPGAIVSQNVTVTLSDIRLNGAVPAAMFALPAGYKIESEPAQSLQPPDSGK